MTLSTKTEYTQNHRERQFMRCNGNGNRCKNGSFKTGFFWALALVTAGTLFILENTGQLGPYKALQFWPLLISFCGMGNLFQKRSAKTAVGGLLTIGVSGVLLAHTLNFISIPWQLIWPAALIGLGIVILIAIIFFKKRPNVTTIPDNAGGKLVMGHRDERCESKSYTEGFIHVVMGEYRLDLSNAEMAETEAQLSIKLTMGEVTVIIPNHWKIAIVGNPLLGEIRDETRQPSMGDPAIKTLNVSADITMGAVYFRN